MLVKVCDVCDERINEDNYVTIEGGFICNKEKYKDNLKRYFYKCNVCMNCARSCSLTQIIEEVRKLNVKLLRLE